MDPGPFLIDPLDVVNVLRISFYFSYSAARQDSERRPQQLGHGHDYAGDDADCGFYKLQPGDVAPALVRPEGFSLKHYFVESDFEAALFLETIFIRVAAAHFHFHCSLALVNEYCSL